MQKFKKIANDLMLFYKVTVNPLSPTSEDKHKKNKYHYRDYMLLLIGISKCKHTEKISQILLLFVSRFLKL